MPFVPTFLVASRRGVRFEFKIFILLLTLLNDCSSVVANLTFLHHHKKGEVVEIRKAYLSMIKSYNGGWDAIAPALGMSRDALENRIYERKGQSLMVETAIQMQAFSGTKFFAEAVATISGGTFVALPSIDQMDNDFIQTKFNETYAELGLLFSAFTAAVQDGEIDAKERQQLEGMGEELHRKTEQLLGVMFNVYCRKSKAVKLVPTAEVLHG